jgi:D-sedoheptulose 7-phosphate isomerase
MTDYAAIIASSNAKARSALEAFSADAGLGGRFSAVAGAMVRTFRNGGKVIVCGNGGSMCDAMHFAEELTGRFRDDRPALAAIAISDPSHITCVANDYGFDRIFSRGVEAHGREGDVLVALSTSGNSLNIIHAVEAAKARRMTTVGLLGKGGGKLAGVCTHEFIVPGETSDRIQELHMIILHTLVEAVEAGMFGK